MKRLLFILAVLCLVCGCGTKKELTVEEHTSQVSVSRQDYDEEYCLNIEDYSHEYDSIVEHIYEMIVTDSSGNVISKTQEHSLDKFKSKKSGTKADMNIRVTDSLQVFFADSTNYNKELEEKVVTRSQKPPWGAYFGILLFICVITIYWRIKYGNKG